MEFYFPETFGEQVAFMGSAGSVVIGLVFMFMPKVALKLFGLRMKEESTDGYALMRSSFAGLYLGLGVAAMLLAQPMVYLAVGITFVVAVFGNILSILSDGGVTIRNCLLLVVNGLLGTLPLCYAFGLV